MSLLRWVLVASILGVGVVGLFLQRRMLAKAVAVAVINSSLVVLFVLLSAETGVDAPILFSGAEDVVDPVLQALMLTAIVIGVCITALLLVLVVQIHAMTGSADVDDVEKWIRDADD